MLPPPVTAKPSIGYEEIDRRRRHAFTEADRPHTFGGGDCRVTDEVHINGFDLEAVMRERTGVFHPLNASAHAMALLIGHD